MTMFPDLQPVPPVERLSAGRALTVRQKADVAAGRHPLMRGLRLLGNGETCGSCAHRVTVHGGARDYPKCEFRVTHSAASDCRAWWPACSQWEAKP